jgi:hypothetical protein
MVLLCAILKAFRLPKQTQSQMISKRIRELIMNAEREKIAREFWEEIEREAAKLEIPVDYYLAEFY